MMDHRRRIVNLAWRGLCRGNIVGLFLYSLTRKKGVTMDNDKAGLAMAAVCAALLAPMAGYLGDWAGVLGCALAAVWFAAPWAVGRWLDAQEFRR